MERNQRQSPSSLLPRISSRYASSSWISAFADTSTASLARTASHRRHREPNVAGSRDEGMLARKIVAATAIRITMPRPV